MSLTSPIPNAVSLFSSKGLDEIVPLKALSIFDEKELELLLTGVAELDVDDWENSTIYRNYKKKVRANK